MHSGRPPQVLSRARLSPLCVCFRFETKTLYNPQFGSIFRTHHNPTYFSRRLFRYSDVYMSHVTNLLKYSLKHAFLPRRGLLPHETRISQVELIHRSDDFKAGGGGGGSA